LALAENLAARAALAIENAQLYRAEQQTRKTAERTSDLLRRLQAVSNSLSQALTPHQVVNAVVEQALNSLGAHAGTVVQLTERGDEIEIVGTVNFNDEIVNKWQRFSINEKVPLADALRNREAVIVESVENWSEKYPALGPLASVTGTRSLVAFPLMVEGRLIGAMGLSFLFSQKFSDDDITFLRALADQCAQAMERARLYETEKQLRKQAESANRLKDEFLATVSHELRTPLNAIVGWSSMLMTNKFDESVTRQAIQTIERNAKTQAQIIEDLLDVSRIITGKMKLDLRPVELQTVVHGAFESLLPSAERKGITVKSDFDLQTDSVYGDPDRLQQIMWNLLSNAIKFTPEGGTVEVKLKRSGTQAQITVRDTGLGIKPEFLPFVFERFSQADATSTRKYGGLGLGLAIVRHLVEMHGGSVGVESEGVGLGATFKVNLPLMNDAQGSTGSAFVAEDILPQTIEIHPFQKQFPNLENLRVLVVEDEPDTRLLLSTIIESSGAIVSVADSAREAFSTIENFQPQILVSDIAMPEEDGYSLIRRIRDLDDAKGGKVPAIALTAYAREEDRVRAAEAGFQRHLAKPINPEDLLAAISELTTLQNGSGD
jgi:signal transduction histidine kinase/ActR/RegA family two-component response regulator